MKLKNKIQDKLWFRAKYYGWGWYPSSWQGWLVLFVFVALIILDFFRLDAHSHSNSDTLRPWIMHIILLDVILIIICWLRGEKPSWRWGKKV